MAIKGKKFNYKHYLRRAHRYLGVFIGVQFILWTIGGLYFSWTNLDEIHGDHLKKHKHISLELPAETISPAIVATTLRSTIKNARIEKIYVIEALGSYFYAIEHLADDTRSTRLYNVENGELRPSISSVEAGEIAKSAFALPGEPSKIEYVSAENIGKHHEYREKPLPAWAVTFDNNASVYVSAETGQIGAIRTDKWRVFDFLWMLHTMDFEGRDNFNNYVLRGFSILGLSTVLSGFLLFFVSSRLVRRLAWRRR
ncbi:MAG TPA: hypothetical protein PKD26_02340 [Pyrinomonadaceae bacterium]|nr:hypothetical protein [Pyrinomonadaceae bacterium]